MARLPFVFPSVLAPSLALQLPISHSLNLYPPLPSPLGAARRQAGQAGAARPGAARHRTQREGFATTAGETVTSQCGRCPALSLLLPPRRRRTKSRSPARRPR